MLQLSSCPISRELSSVLPSITTQTGSLKDKASRLVESKRGPLIP